MLVIQRLRTFFNNAPGLLESLALPSEDTSLQTAVLASVRSQSTKLTEAAQAETRVFLQAVVSRITLAGDEIQILLNKQKLRGALLSNDSSTQNEANQFQGHEGDETIILAIKAQLRRCGGEMRVIVPNSHRENGTAHPNPAMVKAIARAYSWHERLVSGEVKSIRSIATEVGVHERYVSSILRCAFLAPDIVEAILEGRQPMAITLGKLLDDLPIKWDEQRRAFQISDKNQL